MSLRSRSGVQGQGVSRANLLAWASATLGMDIASMDEVTVHAHQQHDHKATSLLTHFC